MTKDELINVAEILSKGGLSDKKQKQYLSMLEDNVPHPKAMDLIYWPPNNKELTPEEIVEKALGYDRQHNQKICCNTLMNELINTLGEITPNIEFGEKTFERKYEFDLRSRSERPDKIKTESIIRKNRVNLIKICQQRKCMLLFSDVRNCCLTDILT